MAEPPSLDPLSLWRDMLGQWERGVNSAANQAMGSDEFSRAMHQMTTLGLRLQQNVGEVVSRSLEAMNLPTRNDLIAINERLSRIEARLDALAEPQRAAKPEPPRPPRTRRPPGA